jgi:hypothetical protein
MNTRWLIALAAGALVAGTPARAQNPAPADSALRRQQRTMDSLAAALRAMQARLDSLTRERGDTAPGDELAALRAAAGAAGGDSSAAASAPRQARLGPNAMNPEISVTGDLRAVALRPGPQTEPFEAREYEIGFQSALDPFSVAKIFVSFEGGEVHIEEGYFYYTGLPGHFRLDLGSFRQQLGELNRWHLHALPEGEYPLVLQRFVGEDGLAATGVSVYWPLPFSGRAGTYEWYAQATKGSNGTLFAGGSRPSWLSQLSGFWQFSRSTYGQLSVTGLYGTNPDTGLATTLGALAARFTWRPPAEGTRKELTVRGELWALRRRFNDTGPTRLGGYVDGTWRLSSRWIVGVRGDWVESPDPAVTGREWAVSPTLTFWESEFVFLRAQFTHHQDFLRYDSERLTLQAVFAMGPHKHELF